MGTVKKTVNGALALTLVFLIAVNCADIERHQNNEDGVDKSGDIFSSVTETINYLLNTFRSDENGENSDISVDGGINESQFGSANPDESGTESEYLIRVINANTTCDTGKCRKSKCNCCPGYGIKEGGLILEKECKKCDCGKNFTCTYTKWSDKTCICPAGFSEKGGVCKADCKTNPCKNEGTCAVEKNDIVCNCKEPYTGEWCEEKKCSKVTCENGGKCIIKEGKAVCNCTDEFTGDSCETEKCSKVTCENGGKCIIKEGNAVCNCTEEYTGDSCETEKCSKLNCENGGKCIIKEGKEVCNCTDEFTGGSCETEKCSKLNCANGGKCIIKEEKPVCNCTEEYTGDSCETEKCSKVNCENGGKCIIKEGKALCNCTDEFTGDSCETEKCSKVNCENGGKCIIKEGKAVCNCTEEFTGESCETEIITSSSTISIKETPTTTADTRPTTTADATTTTATDATPTSETDPTPTSATDPTPITARDTTPTNATEATRTTAADSTLTTGTVATSTSATDPSLTTASDATQATATDATPTTSTDSTLTNATDTTDSSTKVPSTPSATTASNTQTISESTFSSTQRTTTNIPVKTEKTTEPVEVTTSTASDKEITATTRPESSTKVESTSSVTMTTKTQTISKSTSSSTQGSTTNISVKTEITTQTGEITASTVSDKEVTTTTRPEDPCLSNPCQNGGTCVASGDKTTCQCPDNFTGRFCEKVKGEACDKTHKNCRRTGGYCTLNEKSDIICRCPEGTQHESSFGCRVTQETCAKNHPACTKTGGTCNSTKDRGIICDCGESIEYKKNSGCQVPDERCNDEMPLCKNTGGACIFDSEKDIQCLCPTGTGYTNDGGCKAPCDNATKSCKNGGTCEESGNGSFCSCIEGTSGHFCEIVDECVRNSTFCGNDMSATCGFDSENGKAICICDEISLKFDEYSRQCRETCEAFNYKCENGGQCEERGKHQFCNCKKGTSGHRCENIEGCEELQCKTEIALCTYDQITETPFCNCTDDNKIYDPNEEKCFELDGCALKLINNECNKRNEHCEDGECKCKRNYVYSKDRKYCEEDKCVSCPEGFDCNPEADEPCKCNNGFFDGNKCIKYNKCDLGFSKCEQMCDKTTGDCMCAEGFQLSEDNVTCEITAENTPCDLNCYPGSCIKREEKDVCICPIATHEFKNNSCIDICTLSNGNPPEGMNCPGHCESDYDHGIRCICEGFYEQAEDGIHCRRKRMCEKEDIQEECSSKSASCRELTTGKGYECYCEDGFKEDGDNVCQRECDLKRDECIRMNAVCEPGEDYKAECRCLPLLTKKDANSPCSEIAKASYSGDMSFLKSKYVVEEDNNRRQRRSTDDFDIVKLKKDLKDSLKYVYGDDFQDVKLLDCKVDEDLIECEIELQLNEKPEDVNALISPSYCYTLDEEFCLLKNLVIKREKTSKVFEPTDPCVVKETFCDESTDCEADVTNGNFKCTCGSGFRQTGSFKPFGEGNLVEKCADIDECKTKTHKCPESTNCSNTYGSYECICKDGFRKKAGNLNPRKHGCEAVCDPNPCENGGECVQKRSHGFVCKCKPMYSGHTCSETVAVPFKNAEVDHKTAAIVGGVLGTLLVLILIIVVILYRKLNKTKNDDDDDEYARHRQRGVLAEITRLQNKQRKENEDPEMNPDYNGRHARLQRERGEHSRESSEGRIIPRVQVPRNKNDDQDRRDRRSEAEMSRKTSGMTSKEDERSRSKMQFRNRAYNEEE